MSFPAWRTAFDPRQVDASLKGASILGAKPADRRLKRVLYDGLDEFFVPLPSHLHATGDTFTQFTVRRQQQLQRGAAVEIVPRRSMAHVTTMMVDGSGGNHHLPLLGAITSYLTACLGGSVRVMQPAQSRPLDTRFFRRPDGSMDERVVCDKIVDMMSRASSSSSDVVFTVLLTDLLTRSPLIAYSRDNMIIVNVLAVNAAVLSSSPSLSSPPPPQARRPPAPINIFSAPAPLQQQQQQQQPPPQEQKQQQQQQQQHLLTPVKMVARDILCNVFGMGACVYFKCLLNATNNVASAPCILCPVCLRKLLAVCMVPAVDPVRRYGALLAWFRARAPPDCGESAWLDERIHVLSA